LTLKNSKVCPTSINIVNDGHGFTLKHKYADDRQPTITGGPLGKDSYKFVNLHFHWKGEHTINSKQYEAEMHIVFFNTM
jgi:carbonic anhydrase